MNLKQIETFVVVAELGSFSKAAERLHIAQPALSRQVRALEVDLHETLLLRNGRGVTLTEAGRRLLEHGRGILDMVATARSDLGAQRDEPVGPIVIGVPPSLARRITLPLIERCRAEMPRARPVIVEGFSAHITEWLSAGRVDLALVYNPRPLPNLEITPVLQEPLCLVGPAGAIRSPTLAWSQLPRYPLVLPQWDHTFRQLMEHHAALSGVRLNVAFEVSSVPAILDLVHGGLGHAVLTRSAILSDSGRPPLGITPLAEPEVRSTLCLAWSAQRRRTPLMRRTSELLAALVRREGEAPSPAAAPPPRPRRGAQSPKSSGRPT